MIDRAISGGNDDAAESEAGGVFGLRRSIALGIV
jgi:hypothetical protein